MGQWFSRRGQVRYCGKLSIKYLLEKVEAVLGRHLAQPQQASSTSP